MEFEPEDILAFEIGAKSNWWGGRARTNIAAFFYDYENLQQNAIFTNDAGITTNQTVNAANATVFGLEFEGETLLGRSGRLSASLSYLNTEFDEFINFPDVLAFPAQTADVSGNSLPRAPEFKATITYVPAQISLFGGSLEPRIQFSFTDDIVLSPIARDFEIQESFTKTDFTLYWTSPNENFYVEAFVRNIEDDDVANFVECQNFTPQGFALTQCENNFNPPRTYGARFGFNF